MKMVLEVSVKQPLKTVKEASISLGEDHYDEETIDFETYPVAFNVYSQGGKIQNRDKMYSSNR